MRTNKSPPPQVIRQLAPNYRLNVLSEAIRYSLYVLRLT